MQFTSGFCIGVYEVIAPIAAGGMGEVYRARDTTLRRDVAIKVLTRAASSDPDHRARFEREARTVAALSHPNIVSIYGFGIENGIAYAAIEWLEGRTLRQALAHGPLPVRRVVDLGAQIALGLAAAHAKGVTHRDLKPENVFITSEGFIKLLDFGLARVASGASPSSTPETGSDLITEAGIILGTLGYMSPEQVSGSMPDHRSDVFSLGIVLFEMLTGERAFKGGSAVEILNTTLKEMPPPIANSRSDVSFSLDRIVRRCFEKEPAERFQSARDLAFALSQLTTLSSDCPASEMPASQHAMTPRWWLAFALIIGLWIAAMVMPDYWSAAISPVKPVVALTIPPPPDTTLADVPAKMLAISPTGDRLVFAVTRAGHRELWMRHVASTKVEPLPGTHDASEPFWSADGQQVGFFADSKLKRVSIDGTPPVTVCDAPLEARGATWNGDGTILFSDAYGGLSRVAAAGGVPIRVTGPEHESENETDSWPQFLPDGRQFLYLRQRSPSREVGATVYLGTLDGAAVRPLLDGVFNALFVPPGVLVFADAGAIKVQRVDLDHGRMVGDIQELPLDVDRHLGHAAMAISRDGSLAYAAAGSKDHRLVWVDRSGRETGNVAVDDGWRDIALSPDGLHLAVQRIVADANDLWTIDLVRNVPSRFTFSQDVDDDPVWSPDGTRVAFSSVRNGVPGIYQKSVGTVTDDELLFTNHLPLHPSDWSPDGRVLLFEQTTPASASDIWVLPLEGDRSPRPYLETSFFETDAHFSPDGRWVAYTSNESGRNEVYVQSFPHPHEKMQVSTRGGVSPRWAPSGRELYFLSAEGGLIGVKATLSDRLRLDAPTLLFDTSVGLGDNRYVPAHDGKRFLLSIGTAQNSAAHLVVILNWADHLTPTQSPH